MTDDIIGAASIMVTVTDSRNRTVNKSAVVSVVSYASPKLSSVKSEEQLQEAVVDAMNTVLEYSDDVKHFGREYPGGDLSR